MNHYLYHVSLGPKSNNSDDGKTNVVFGLCPCWFFLHVIFLVNVISFDVIEKRLLKMHGTGMLERFSLILDIFYEMFWLFEKTFSLLIESYWISSNPIESYWICVSFFVTYYPKYPDLHTIFLHIFLYWIVFVSFYLFLNQVKYYHIC